MLISLLVFFSVLFSPLNSQACESSEAKFENESLSYSKTTMCSLMVSFNYPDGSRYFWHFLPNGEITISAENKTSMSWGYLSPQQIIRTPKKNAPRILSTKDKLYLKNANPNNLYLLLANGKIASINKITGAWDFSGAIKGKIMTTQELAIEIDKMKAKLDEIYPDITRELETIPSDIKVKLNSKPPKTEGVPEALVIKNKMLMSKYRQQNIMQNLTRIPDLFAVEAAPGIENYGTRFGTPPTAGSWKNKKSSKESYSPAKASVIKGAK